MDLGHCPRCSHPYTTSEVVGFGILRARAAAAGGPRVEYSCPGCASIVHLIPYGEGRYAQPGEPPPAAVPEAERRPPWATDGAAESRRTPPPPSPATAPEDAPAAARQAAARSGRPAEAESPPEPERVSTAEGHPMGPAEALDLLGVMASAEASEIDRAFRELSLTCHPDKVAHLDVDFQDLAERKFKRLLRAYEILSS